MPNNTIENRNKAFNGDGFILEQFKKIVSEYKIKTIIETGTHLGETTFFLSDMADHVISYETDKNWFNGAKNHLKDKKNVELHLMNSVDGLKKHLPKISGNVMFFLDAHWEQYNPLIDELKVIAENKLRPVICIHDWKVPGRPELGFDSYKGQDYEFSWIEESLNLIYGELGFKYHFNDKAEGAMRGVIYIYPND